MNTIKIDNKKHVVIPQKKYEGLQKLAASKNKPGKSMTIKAARANSKKRIQQ